MLRIIFLSIVFIFAITSCSENKKGQEKPENITKTSQKSDIEPDYKESDLVPLKVERNILEDRAEAKTSIKSFLNNKPKYEMFLTTYYYIVDYVSDGKGAPKDLIDLGEWYKFETDFSYQHGVFDIIADEGKYSYDIDKGKLLLLPNKEDQFPSEWKLMHSDNVIVLVGTAKFGNNPFQKHMLNIEKQPEVK